jgi:PASTA domain
MPGQLSDGVTATRDSKLDNSKAFCEGRQAKAWTESTNPHPTGSEANAAWAAGYALTVASGVQGPCNITPGITVPNVVGQTQAAATASLIAAGLVLGVVTLTTGNVTIQSPVAAAVVRPRTAVNITLTS